jgi:hypothetical protein
MALKTMVDAASETITSTIILLAVNVCSSPPLWAINPSRNLLPDSLLVLGGDVLLSPLLNSRNPVRITALYDQEAKSHPPDLKCEHKEERSL